MFETMYGVFVGTITFCLWSLFTKGFAEDVASYYGKKWISFFNVKARLLEQKVQVSITQIDNVLLDLPVGVLRKIDEIVNVQNDEQKELIDKTYKLTKLLEKYYEQNSTFAGKLDERS